MGGGVIELGIAETLVGSLSLTRDAPSPRQNGASEIGVAVPHALESSGWRGA